LLVNINVNLVAKWYNLKDARPFFFLRVNSMTLPVIPALSNINQPESAYWCRLVFSACKQRLVLAFICFMGVITLLKLLLVVPDHRSSISHSTDI